MKEQVEGKDSLWERLNPRVPKAWLFLLSGVMWSVVGLMLMWLAYGWLTAKEIEFAFWFAITGLSLGVVSYKFSFIHIAFKNIRRLCSLPDKNCLFAFQEWKGYFIIAFMMTLGITLRSSSLPKHYLAVVYLIIGLSLFLASFHYYHKLWHVKVQKRPCVAG